MRREVTVSLHHGIEKNQFIRGSDADHGSHRRRGVRFRDGNCKPLRNSPWLQTRNYVNLMRLNAARSGVKFVKPENTKNMETIRLTIPNMKSQHCQMTVAAAVHSVGAKVKSLEPTRAEIELTNGVSSDAAIAAIRNAGYNVVN